MDSVAFSPDGRTLASSDDDGTVRLWDVDSGRLRTILQGFWDRVDGRMYSVTFSPDGRTLASAALAGTVHLWDVDSGRLRHTLQEHDDHVTSVAFSPDGRTLASADEGGTVRLWETDGGRLRHTLRRHEALVYSVAFSPDGHTLASVSKDGTVRLWEADGGRLRHTLQGNDGSVNKVAFSPDGHMLATAGDDGTVRLWEADGGRLRHTLQGHVGWVSSVAFSPVGHTLASGDGVGTVRLWEADSGRLRHVLRWHVGWVSSVAFSPDGRTLASKGDDGTVRLWEADSGRLRYTLESGGWGTNVAFSPDGRILASAGRYHIRLWDLSTPPETTGTVMPAPVAASDPVLLQLGRTTKGYLESADEEDVYHVTLDDDTAYRIEVELRTPRELVMSLFGPNGKKLVENDAFDYSAGSSRYQNILVSRTYHIPAHVGLYQIRVRGDGLYIGSYRLSVTEMRRPRQVLEGHDGSVNKVTFSPDGRIIASAGDDGTVRLWETDSGHLRRILVHGSWVNQVVFSPDGRILAGAGGHGVHLWETDSGRLHHVLAYDSNVTTVIFSPDGRTFASGSLNGTVRLWATDDGRLRHILQVHDDHVTAVAFSPDGRVIASASNDGTVGLWDADDGRLLHGLPGFTVEPPSEWNPVRVADVAFNPDGRILASAGKDDIRLWEVATGTLQAALVEPVPEGALSSFAPAFRSVAMSSDGRTLASASNRAFLWDIDSGKPRYASLGGCGSVEFVAFSPDGHTLVGCCGSRATVFLWDVDSGRLQHTLEHGGRRSDMTDVVFSPDGRTLASAGDEGTVRLWNLAIESSTGSTPKPTQTAVFPSATMASSVPLQIDCIMEGSIERTGRTDIRPPALPSAVITSRHTSAGTKSACVVTMMAGTPIGFR